MAASDVGSAHESPSSSRLSAGFDGAWLRAYAGIWLLTLGAAATVAIVGRPLSVPIHRLLGLRLDPSNNPSPGVTRVLRLAAHNIPIVAWPLLLGILGAQRHRLGRALADCLVLACIAANVVPVGAAFGAYGVALLPYVPQLPLEWAALALGAGAWMNQRRNGMSAREGLMRLTPIACLLVCAGVIETAAVPHR